MKATKVCLVSLVVLLAFVFAMSFIPTQSLGTAHADDVVDKVELEIDSPVNGVSALSNIAHIKDAEENRYYVRFTNWFDITADKDMTHADDVFVGGHAYRVSVTVCIMPSLYPATQFLVSGLGNPDVTAKVNGELASTMKSYSNDAKQTFVIVYEFMSSEYGEVTMVKIDGLSAPAAGQKPDFDVEIAEGECHANTNMGSKNGIVWYDPALNSIVAENNTFVLGKVYETQLNYEVEEGFYFAPGLEVYLNGEKLPSGSYSYINQFLTITKSYTCEKAQIKNVDITGIDAPTWESGNPKTPDYTATIGENYALLADDEHAEDDRYSGVQWWDVEIDDTIKNTDTFEGNKIYKARFYLKVTDPINYEFAMNGGLSAVTATVNGEVAECTPIFGYGGDYGDYLQVTYTFAPTGNTINNIYLDGLVVPENTEPAGAQSAEKIATGAGYSLYELTWYDSDRQHAYKGNFEYGEGSNTYYALLSLETKGAYEFGEYELHINGVHIDKADIIEQYVGNKMLNLFVPFTCAEKSIGEVYVFLTEPVSGELPSNTLEAGDTSKYAGISTHWYLNSDYSSSPVSSAFENGAYGAKMQIATIEGYRFAEHVKVHVNNSIDFYADSESSAALVAKWEFQSAPAYTITFDANEGSGSMEPLTYVKNGTVVNLPDCEFTAPDSDHHFVGWSESSTVPVVDNPYTFNNAADLTLYAIWEEYHEYDSIEIDTSALTGATTAIVLSTNDIASGSVKVVTNGWTMKDGTPIEENAAINDGDNRWYVIKFTEDADHYMFFPEDISQETVGTLVQIKGTARYFASAIIYDSFERSITVKTRYVCNESGIRSNQINFNFFNDDRSQKITYTVPIGSTYVLPTLGKESGEVDFTVDADKKFVGWLYDYGDGDITSYAPSTQIIALVDRDFVIDLKNIYEITLNFGDKGDNIVFEVEGEMEWDVIEYFNVAPALDESLLKVGNKYLVGFAESPVAEDADFATLSEMILREQVIDKSCTVYAVYVTLPDSIFGVTNPSEKELSNNGSIQDVGKLTLDSYPYYYWLNDYVYFDISIEFEGGQLVGTNDNQDKLDFEVYSNKITDFAITIGGQRMMISSSPTDGLDAFGTIAGNKEFVYIDGYGTEEEFEAVASILNGKIAVVKRGGITFAQKAGFADAAGAIGIIYVNNTDDIGFPSVDSYEGKIPCGMVTLSDGALLKSGEKKTLGGVDYYEGSFTVSAEEEEFYFNDSYYKDNNTMCMNPEEEWSAGVWVKILDPSKIKNGETYTGVITYKVKITDGFDEVVASFQKTTNLTVVGDEIDPDPQEIQPDPSYPHENVDGKEVYTDEIYFGTNVDVSVVFASAKAGHGVVKIDVATMGLSILFDENAVNAIGGKEVTLNANLITAPFNAPYSGMEGLDCVFDLTLTGATFAGGSATITLHREIEVPEGKQVKVYYLNGGEKVACTTTYSDNELSFSTNHFSAFGAFIEDATEPQPQPVDPEPQPSNKGGLGGGAIAGIVIAVLVVVLGGACLCLFLLNKKGIIHLAFLDKLSKKGGADTESVGEDSAEEPKAEEPAAEPAQAEEPAQEPKAEEPEQPAEEPKAEE